MASDIVEIKLSKFDNQPWGFRMTGGREFRLPLTIQRVIKGSLAEQAGLRACDILMKLNGEPTSNLSHKAAQDAIIRAGNNFSLSVMRGTPSAAPSSPHTLPRPNKPKPQTPAITDTRPLTPILATTAPQVDQGLLLPSDQPVSATVTNGGLSEDDIAETLLPQAEIIAQQAIGVNFKKFEPKYEFLQHSAVFRMLHNLPEEEPPRPGSLSERLDTVEQEQKQRIVQRQQDQEQKIFRQQEQQQLLLQQKQAQEQQQLQQQQQEELRLHQEQLQQQRQQQQQQQQQKQQRQQQKKQKKEITQSQKKELTQSQKANAIYRLQKFVKRPITAPRIKPGEEDEYTGPSFPAGIAYRPAYPLTPAAPFVIPQPPPPPPSPPPSPVDEEVIEPPPPEPLPLPAAVPETPGVIKPIGKPAAFSVYRPTEWKKRTPTSVKSQPMQQKPQPLPMPLPKAVPQPKPQSPAPQPKPAPQRQKPPAVPPQPKVIPQPKPQAPPPPKPQMPARQPQRRLSELYNEETIAETMISNAEVIKGSVMGVNFKRFEKGYDHLQNSAVYRLIHGLDEEPAPKIARLPEKVDTSEHYQTVCFNKLLQTSLNPPSKPRPGSTAEVAEKEGE